VASGSLVTFEESVVAGGFGSAVLEAIEAPHDIALRDTAVRIVGIPADRSSTTARCRPATHPSPRRAAGLTEQVREAWPRSRSRRRAGPSGGGASGLS